jgi:hypothetical protein
MSPSVARVCPSPTIKQKHSSRPFTSPASAKPSIPYSPSRSQSSSLNWNYTNKTSSVFPASHVSVDAEQVKKGRGVGGRPSTAPSLSVKTDFGNNETHPSFPFTSEKIVVVNPLCSSTSTSTILIETTAVAPSRHTPVPVASLPMTIPTTSSTISSTISGGNITTMPMPMSAVAVPESSSSPVSPTQTQLSSPSYLSSSFSSSYTTCSDASSAATTATFSDTATTIDTIVTSAEGGSRGKKNGNHYLNGRSAHDARNNRANNILTLPWFLASSPSELPAPTSTWPSTSTSPSTAADMSFVVVQNDNSSPQIKHGNEAVRVIKEVDDVASSISQEEEEEESTEKGPSSVDPTGTLSLSDSFHPKQEIKVISPGGMKATSLEYNPASISTDSMVTTRKRSDAISPSEMTFNDIAYTALSTTTTTIFTTPSFLDFDSPIRKNTYRASSFYAGRTDQGEEQVDEEMIEEIPDYIMMKGFEAQERHSSIGAGAGAASAANADAIARRTCQIRPAHSLSRFIEDFPSKDKHSDEEHVFRPLSGLPVHPSCKRSFTAPSFVFSSPRMKKSLPSIPVSSTSSSGITSGTLNALSYGALPSTNSEDTSNSKSKSKSNSNSNSNTRDNLSSPSSSSSKTFPSLFDMGDVQVPAEEEAIHALCQEEEYEEFFERTAFPLPKMSWWPEPPLDNDSSTSAQQRKKGKMSTDKAVVGLKQSFGRTRSEEKNNLQLKKKKLSIGYPMLLPLRRSSSSPITITSSSSFF